MDDSGREAPTCLHGHSILLYTDRAQTSTEDVFHRWRVLDIRYSCSVVQETVHQSAWLDG